MIVERLEVRNWRGLRERHVFEFEEGINLLVGKNESGKSTIFEALQRTLFDRHGTQAQQVKDIRPIGSSLAPEAEVTVRADGDRYRIRKRFLDDPESVFSVDRDGAWEREHDGDRADEEARKLVDGDVPGRGATKIEHRGLGQALWYLQRERPVPDDEWNEAIREGLGGLLDVTATSPAERRVLERVRNAYDENWTPKTGKLSVNSTVGKLEEEIASLESELEEVRSRLEQADRLRGELEDHVAQRQQYLEALGEVKKERERLQELLDEARELEEKKEELQRAADDAERELEDTADDLETLETLDGDIEEIRERVERARDAASDARHRAETGGKKAAEARRRRREELEPERKRAADQVRGLQALQRIRELEGRREELERELAELREKRGDLKARKSELRELRAPSEKEIEIYREAMSDLAVVDARIDASAIRVVFDFEGEPEVSSRPEAETEEDEEAFLVTEPTVFSVGALGTVSVEGVGPTLEDLRDEAEELQATTRELEQRYDAEDQDELEAAVQRRQALEGEINGLEEEVEGLRNEDELEDDLAGVQSDLQESEDRTEVLSNDQLELTGEALHQAIEDLEDRQEELGDAIEEAESEEDKASEENEELSQEAQQRATEVSSLEARIEEKGARKAEVLEEYGTRTRLEEEHADRKEALKDREEDLADVEDEFEEKVVSPREELDRTKGEIQRIQEQVQELEQGIAGVQGQVEEIADQEVYTRAGDLEAQLEQKRRRLEVVRTRAEGAKLAKELLEALQKGRRETLAAPVNEKVDRWVQVLTDGRYDRLEVDEKLHPSAVRHTRYDTPLGVDQLSFGTQEQVVVLFRLAIGTVLGEEEPQLVILDDRLVNADSIRTRRFCDILEDASSKCQILLSTCAESRYGRLSAQRIRVPEDGRAVEGGRRVRAGLPLPSVSRDRGLL